MLSSPAEGEAAPIRVTRRSSSHSNPDTTPSSSTSSLKKQASPEVIQPLEAKSFVFKPRSPSESSCKSAQSSGDHRRRTQSVASVSSTASAVSSAPSTTQVSICGRKFQFENSILTLTLLR